MNSNPLFFSYYYVWSWLALHGNVWWPRWDSRFASRWMQDAGLLFWCRFLKDQLALAVHQRSLTTCTPTLVRRSMYETTLNASTKVFGNWPWVFLLRFFIPARFESLVAYLHSTSDDLPFVPELLRHQCTYSQGTERVQVIIHVVRIRRRNRGCAMKHLKLGTIYSQLAL